MCYRTVECLTAPYLQGWPWCFIRLCWAKFDLFENFFPQISHGTVPSGNCLGGRWTLWTFLLCCATFDFFENIFPQISHGTVPSGNCLAGRWTLWTFRLCWRKLEFFENFFPQISHGTVPSCLGETWTLCIFRLCWVKFDLFENLFPQISHGNVPSSFEYFLFKGDSFSCLSRWCAYMCCFWLKVLSQKSHLNLSPVSCGCSSAQWTRRSFFELNFPTQKLQEWSRGRSYKSKKRLTTLSQEPGEYTALDTGTVQTITCIQFSKIE